MDVLTAMSEDHLDVIEQLPDYAVGALDDLQMDTVARHLGECASCRYELRQVLQIVSIISDAPFPNPATRENVLAQARGQERPKPTPAWPPAPPAPPPSAAGMAEDREHPLHARAWRVRPAAIALAMAAGLLIIALGIANLRMVQDGGSDAVIASIIADATLYPLTDGDLSPPAAGVLFAAADESRAVLLAQGLPPLPADRRYQLWLFTDAGERSSGGLFAPDADGRARVLFETPRPIAAYAAVAISAEPAAGSPAPSSPLALGGWLD